MRMKDQGSDAKKKETRFKGLMQRNKNQESMRGCNETRIKDQGYDATKQKSKIKDLMYGDENQGSDAKRVRTKDQGSRLRESRGTPRICCSCPQPGSRPTTDNQ